MYYGSITWSMGLKVVVMAKMVVSIICRGCVLERRAMMMPALVYYKVVVEAVVINIPQTITAL